MIIICMSYGRLLKNNLARYSGTIEEFLRREVV
jgi:hypothetical protein